MGLFVGTNEPSKIFVGDTPISKCFLGDTQVRPSGGGGTVQTFDFQNDGDLGWTATGNATPAIASGEGWYIGTSNYSSYQGSIIPPSSIFSGGTLKKVKIYFYRPQTTTSSRGSAVGIDNKVDSWIEYGRFGDTTGRLNVCYSGSSSWLSVQDLIGEVEMEAVLETNGHITINFTGNGNTYSYDGGVGASVFQTAWENGTLELEIGRWNSTTNYIRKVEITTA